MYTLNVRDNMCELNCNGIHPYVCDYVIVVSVYTYGKLQYDVSVSSYRTIESRALFHCTEDMPV